MRTLFLAPELFTNNGGIPRILRLYLKAISDTSAGQNGKLRFVALNDTLVDSSELRRYSNIHLESWEVCSGNKLQFVKAAWFHGKKCDHVICGHVAQLPIALLLKLRNPKLTYDVIAHGIEVWRSFSIAELISLKFARKVLCISDYTRRRMSDFCSLPKERMVVLPNGLDPYFPITKEASAPPSIPTITTVARLTKADVYKGVDSLINAMPLVVKQIPNAKLRIIGQGDDALRLRRLADRLSLQQTVDMLGFVADTKLQEALRTSTLFALPSKKEGFGLVFIEAMAQGRPCLGANAGGIPEVITEETGILIDYGNIQQIADACVAALNKNWSTEKILQRAHFFSYNRFLERFIAIFPQTRK